ncbi:hypothetical protein SAMN05421877_11936 [Sphingobacterium lactis]|uniref:Uncharacterized protein n=1 Tax=Sphingobacterium lactis TaxID=797291 RepID=A0A1H6CS98_9SPHI|nr:hypothetical protein SAMN05421877_11936 [Sphingobacterium lactis]
MQEAIDIILQAIKECENPLKNTDPRNIRDLILNEIGATLIDKSREEVEGYARNDDEASALHWFYTRFVGNKVKSKGSKRMGGY